MNTEEFYTKESPYLWNSDEPQKEEGHYGKEDMKRFAEEYYKAKLNLLNISSVSKSLPTNKELTLISEQVIKDECKEFNKLGKLNIKLGILHYHKYLQQRDMK